MCMWQIKFDLICVTLQTHQNSRQHLDMYATKVQHSPSATISIKPSTHTVWLICSINPRYAPHRNNCNCLCNTMLQGTFNFSLEINVILLDQNARHCRCDRSVSLVILYIGSLLCYFLLFFTWIYLLNILLTLLELRCWLKWLVSKHFTVRSTLVVFGACDK